MTAVTPRPTITCPECQEKLVHRLITLHAGEDTMLVCEGSWEALPNYLREAYGHAKGTGLSKRREIAQEIRDHLRDS